MLLHNSSRCLCLKQVEKKVKSFRDPGVLPDDIDTVPLAETQADVLFSGVLIIADLMFLLLLLYSLIISQQ